MRTSNPDYLTQAGVSSEQAALARHHSYALVSRILLEGVTTNLLPYLRQIDRLAERLPGRYDVDDAAAVHYHIFGFNIFAYESVFLSSGTPHEPAALGGDVTHLVEQVYRRAGYHPVAFDMSPDHIGYEMAFMAFLCGAEADAWEDDLPDIAEQVRARQRDFLQMHLLRWLPALNEAIRSQNQPFYSAVADLSDDLVQSHALALSPLAPVADWLPQAPALLDDRKTGVRQIAHYLTTPCYSGIYLSRDTLANLARRLALPRGFGSRQQLLENLFQSAAQYEATEALLEALDAVASKWSRAYETAGAPELDPYLLPWRERAKHTRQLLQEMRVALQTSAD